METTVIVPASNEPIGKTEITAPGNMENVVIDEIATTPSPTMNEIINKPLTKRQMLLKMIGAASILSVPLQTRLTFGLGYIRGDKFYLGLPMKRVKGKWKVKH